jgi:hypothetical protein
MLLLVVGLRMRLGALRGAEILASAARVVGASCIAGAAAWAVARLLTGLPRWLPGIAGALAFTALFAIASWALGARELGEIAAPLKRRLLRRRA